MGMTALRQTLQNAANAPRGWHHAVPHAGWDELHFACPPVNETEFGDLMGHVQAWVAGEGMALVGLTAIGDLSAANRRALRNLCCPVHLLRPGLKTAGAPISLQFVAARGVSVEPIAVDGQVVATVVEDRWARHAYIAGLEAPAVGTRQEQFRAAFDAIVKAAGAVGMRFEHIARTWLYIDDILDWYDDLNAARHAFLAEVPSRNPWPPASTGIGLSPASGSSALFGALGVLPHTDEVTVRPVRSPLQCEAGDYGSAFSRASEIATPEGRRLLISGTASIGQAGDTVELGDFVAQINQTARVVDAILEENGYTHKDVIRSRAYVRRPADLATCADHLWVRSMPTVIVQADVCRDDLLFEIELDAVKA